jgi:CheY-like chemotaxis protein
MSLSVAWKMQRLDVTEGSFRVLVVDDAPDVALMLRHFLEGEGCEVDTAATGAEALALYWGAVNEGRGYDLIFLDSMLPGADGLDGLAVARRVRSAERESGGRESYVCGYTAHAEAFLAPGTVERAGLDEFLVKSSNADEMAALRTVLTKAREKRGRPLGVLPGGARRKA